MKISKVDNYTFFRDNNTGMLTQSDRATAQPINNTNSYFADQTEKGVVFRLKKSVAHKNAVKAKVLKPESKPQKQARENLNKTHQTNLANFVKANVAPENLNGKFAVPQKAYDRDEVKTALNDALTHEKNTNFYAEHKQAAMIKNFFAVKLAMQLNSLKGSIESNTIPFYIDPNNNIVYNTPARCFLQTLKTTLTTNYDLFESELNSWHAIYGLEELVTTINDTVAKAQLDRAVKAKQVIRAHISKHLKQLYRSSLLQSNPNAKQQYFLYAAKLTAYFDWRFQRKKKSQNYVQTINVSEAKRHIEGRIKNTVSEFMINEGKIIKAFTNMSDSTGNAPTSISWDKKTFNSNDYIQIAKEEVLGRRIISACVFATNNLRSIVCAPSNTRDVLGYKAFKALLPQLNISDSVKKFNLFYDANLLNPNPEDYKTLLWVVRGSVQQVRNKVYHAKHLNAIFDYTNQVETAPASGIEFKQTVLATLLQNEIDNYKTLYKNKLDSMKLFDYYSSQVLSKAFEIIGPVDAFKTKSNLPEFSKVQEKIVNLKLWSNPERFEQLVLAKKEDSTQTKEQALAIRMLLTQIYQNSFQGYFYNHTNFVAALNKTKARIIKSIKDNTNKQINSIDKIPAFDSETTVQNYLSKLQSKLALEAYEIENKADAITDEEQPKDNFYTKFIIELLAHAFSSFVKQKGFDAMIMQTSKVQNKQDNIASVPNITIKKPPVNITNQTVAFYAFAKLLDQQSLNNLQHELIKSDPATYKTQIDILTICQSSNDKNFEVFANNMRSDNEIYTTFLSSFIEPDALESYNNNTDQVYFKSAQQIIKHSTFPLLQHFYADHKVNKSTISSLPNLNLEGMLNTNREIRQKWIKKSATESDYTTFKQNTQSMLNYEQLKKEITLTNVYLLHKLIMDILAKSISFTSLFEKNIQFFSFSYFYAMSNQAFIPDNVFILTGHKLNTDTLFTTPNAKKIYIGLLLPSGNTNGTTPQWKTIRNKIAHLDYLKQLTPRKSLAQMIFELRTLMTKNRKHKNSVVKSFVNLFEKHNLQLVYTETQNDKKTKITSTNNIYLKGKYKLAHHHPNYINQLCSFFSSDN